jgi:type I restriction enzyme R subunit
VLLLNAELSALRSEPFERERRKVMQVAGALEDQHAIPVVAQQLELIQEVQTDDWWVDVSSPMLEEVRRKLQLLVPPIERSKKSIIYSNFVDDLGDGADFGLPGTGGAIASTEFLQFRKSAEQSSRNTSVKQRSPRSVRVRRSPGPTSRSCSASLPRSRATPTASSRRW